MHNIKVISVEDDGYYSDAYTSGSCVKVTLERDGDFATCAGILIWDEELVDDALFDEWVDMAKAGEEGYSAIIEDFEGATLYGTV